MATEVSTSATNGEPSQDPSDISPAALLQQKHAQDEAHRATVEEVVDEDDIQHPPPAAVNVTSRPQQTDGVNATMSEKAAGKQKAQDPTPPAKPASKPVTLNTQSKEEFPSLGGGNKPRAPPLWGASARKPPAPGKASANGVSNGLPSGPSLSSAPSSRASTPASGLQTPSSTNASATPQPRGPSPAVMSSSIPGQGGSHTERIGFTKRQLQTDSQLKKPLPVIVQDINKRSKANIQMIRGQQGQLYFEGKGPVEAVRQALKEIAQLVGSKQSIRVPIPASTRSHIIGKQGSTIQGIQKRTGANIQFPKIDDSAFPADDDATIDVTIEGDAVSAEMARREIETIVNERTSTVNLRLKEIPPEFFPFIAGARNSRLNDLHRDGKIEVRVPDYDTWSHQPPPQTVEPSQPPQFVPDPKFHIQISGDRQAAQAARAQIEQLANQLRQEIILRQIAIDRRRHQFIVGENGSSLHDFLAETGCGIILPPEHNDTEFVTISGPPDRIDFGVNRAIDLASSMQKENIDLCRLHPTAPNGSVAHAQALTRYLREREEIAKLEQKYSAHIVVPTSADGPMTWDVFSKEGKSGIHARSDITNLVLAHPPTRVRHINVDPFFHQHIHSQVFQELRNKFGVHTMLPEEQEDEQVILVFEAPPEAIADYQLPRQRPSPAEVAEFEKALIQAQEHVLDLIRSQENIIGKFTEVPQKYHDKLRRFLARERQAAPADEIPLLVNIGESRSRNGGLAPHQSPIAAASMESTVQLRGPEERVNDLESKIQAFVAEQQQDELERGFTLKFDFPQKFASHLIGTKGANIRKLRDEFDVEIDLKDGVVTLQGPKAKAERAKASIIAWGKQLEDETRHVIKIHPQYHGDLIGAHGKDVNRLQERHKVRIQFPRSPKAALVNDDQSTADTMSDVGGSRNVRPTQNADEVVIRGPRQGADKAKEELLSLLQFYVDRSFTSSISVPKGLVPSLIGKDGREIQKTRDEFDVSIDVPKDADASGRFDIKVKGGKKQVEEAKKALAERAKIFDETVTRTIDVDKKYHRALIGSGGANVRKIVVDAGGPDDKSQFSRIIKFPGAQSEDTAIRVEGNKEVVEKIIASINEQVKQKENSTADTLDIAPEKHRRLIGRDGETRKGIESQFNVGLDVPRKDSGKTAVKITGLRADVDKAKEHILGLVTNQGGETVQVPKHVHHQIADNGKFFRRLRNDIKVTVDHGGEQLPPKPKGGELRSRPNGANMPLITDETDSSDKFSWDVVHNETPAEGQENIPWNLSGDPDNVAKARALLESALNSALQPSSTGYLILPDPKTYRFVVGPNGSHINAMRKKTGCQIQVPNDKTKSEAIEITGPQAGVEQAKDLILEAVKNGQNNGGRA